MGGKDGNRGMAVLYAIALNNFLISVDTIIFIVYPIFADISIYLLYQ